MKQTISTKQNIDPAKKEDKIIQNKLDSQPYIEDE